MPFKCSSFSSALIPMCSVHRLPNQETFKDEINLNASECRAVMMGRFSCLKYRHHVKNMSFCCYSLLHVHKLIEKERERK